MRKSLSLFEKTTDVRYSGWAWPYVIFLIVMAVASLSYFSMLRQETEAFRELLAASADEYAHRVSDGFDTRVLQGRASAGRLSRVAPEELIDAYLQEAAFLTKQVGGFQAVNLIGVEGRIDHVFPDDQSNADAKNKDLTKTSHVSAYLSEAIASKKAVITAPIDLFQGGKGLVGYLAIFDSTGKHRGTLNLVFRLEDTIRSSLAFDSEERFGIVFQDVEANQEVFVHQPKSPLFDSSPTSLFEFELLGRAYQMAVTPTQAYADSRALVLPDIILLAEIFLAVALAFFVRRAIYSRHVASQSRLELAEILEKAPLHIYVKDLDGKYLFQSQESERAYGISPEFIIGKTDHDLLPPDMAKKIVAEDLRVVSEDRMLELTEEVLIEGEKRSFRSLRFPLHDESGQIRALCGMSIDISEERQFLERALESEERYRSIYHRTPVMLHSIDRDGKLLSVSEYWLRALGYAEEEVLGRRLAEFLDEESKQGNFSKSFSQFLEEGVVNEVELTFLTRNGSKIETLVSGIAERDPNGDFTRSLSVAVDVTERNKALREFERLNSELESHVAHRTQRLEEVVEELRAFTYAVSHDLRAPLRAVSGFAQILAESVDEELSVRNADAVRRIQSAAQRMTDLIEDLLRLSRISHVDLTIERFSLSELAEEVVAEVVQEYSDGNPPKITIEEGIRTFGDRRMVRIALRNLFDNALKFSSGEPQAEISLRSELEAGQQVFVLSDNGVGFDAEMAAVVTQPFSRLHSADEFAGTGIGLATVNRIVMRHGGWLRVSGGVGKGATIRFALSSIRESRPLSRVDSDQD